MNTFFLLVSLIGSLLAIIIIFLNRKRILQNAKLNIIKKHLDKKIDKKAEIKESSVNLPTGKRLEYKKLINRAEILIEHHETKEAEKILISLLADNKKYAPALRILSSLYLQRKQYSKSEALYNTLNEIEKGENPTTLSNLAFCLFERNQIKKAHNLYKQALLKDIKNIKRYTNLGQVIYVLKEYDEAVSLFKKALHIDPRNTDILFMLADTYLALKLFSKAKETFKKILQYEPYSQDARAELLRMDSEV
ncbi:hypothetical protein COB57_05170 [Candidatus Peregrinibacteria bacterium]|nr:MAG: hypothetical protein COB57_05170 [Candidatus Peregrinibacteria bacterium]